MRFFSGKPVVCTLWLCLLSIAEVRAQQPQPQPDADWEHAQALAGVDFLDLKPVQKQTVLKLLREKDCSCQCGMKIAECRFKDPGCFYSTSLAKIAIENMRRGKTVAEIRTALTAGPKYKRPKLLEDPVKIPVEGSPLTGPKEAKIVLIEFSDFECPYCSQAAAAVKNIMTSYPGNVRLIYKQFPLSMHPHAKLAAIASLAAADQDKFWQMHDALFANFRKLTRENILSLAQGIGLDMNRFTADLGNPKYDAIIAKDMQDGEAAGVAGTPAFFINGKLYNGPMDLNSVKPIFDGELSGKPVVAER
jgi:protein-disulfide isomerase